MINTLFALLFVNLIYFHSQVVAEEEDGPLITLVDTVAEITVEQVVEEAEVVVVVVAAAVDLFVEEVTLNAETDHTEVRCA